MNWLQWSLHTLRRVFPFGPRRAAPWRLVKCEVLLAKCQCSVRFLTACRRNRIVPRFIRNCSKTSKLFGDQFRASEEKYHWIVLNRIIREKFCHIKYLRRECHARRKDVYNSMMAGDAKWVVGHSRCMFDLVAAENSRNLRCKMEVLLREKERISGGEVEVGSTHGYRRSRVVVEAVEATARLPESARALMERGPKFVPKRKVTKPVLRKAEIGVERLAFGRRWQKVVEGAEAVKERDKIDGESNKDAGRPVRCLDDDVRLKKISKTTKQGPPMEAIEENSLIRLKDNIMKLYKQAERVGVQKGHGHELTRKEREDISGLLANEDIIIKPSDKSKGFVVMSQVSYVEKVNEMLENADNYERCCQMKVENLDKITRSTIKRIASGKLPAALYNSLLPSNSRMSQFYGLPKDHKVGLPLRPVVSTCGSPLSNVSLLLERILNQLLRFIPAHLASTEDCIKVLHSLGKLPDNCIVASMDVVALYTNIPIDDSSDTALEMLDEHSQEIDMFHLSLSDIRQLLDFVLKSNYFAFGEKVYRQIKGLAMGNNLAPPLAIIFMSKLESEAIASAPFKPRLYKRYIDDCLVVWLHGLERLLEFVEFMNSRHPNIKFTIEHTEQNEEQSVSYLDMSVSVDKGFLSWELFMKPSHSGVHLSYDSALPVEVKRSVALEQFRRAERNSNTDHGRNRGREKIEELLLDNDYPHDVVTSAKRRATHQRRQRTGNRGKEQCPILKLPYIDDHLARQVRRSVRSFDKTVRVVFEAGPSLKDMLVSSSFARAECPRVLSQQKKKRGRPTECRACDAGLKNGDCMKKAVVYAMQCSICDDEYVGETERCVRERFKEHHRQACASTPGTPWGYTLRKSTAVSRS